MSDIVTRLRKLGNDEREMFRSGSRSWMLEAADEIESLREKLGKVVNWLDRLAVAAEKSAKDTRFKTLAEANAADAKNYRKTIADLKTVLPEQANTGSAR